MSIKVMKHRVRKPSLATALKQAEKAGKLVRGAALYGDHVELTFREPALTELTTNPWDAVFDDNGAKNSKVHS